MCRARRKQKAGASSSVCLCMWRGGMLNWIELATGLIPLPCWRNIQWSWSCTLLAHGPGYSVFSIISRRDLTLFWVLFRARWYASFRLFVILFYTGSHLLRVSLRE